MQKAEQPTLWECECVLLIIIQDLCAGGGVRLVEGNGVDERVVVERREVRVLHLNVHDHRVVVRAQAHPPRPVVVQIGECHLHSNRLVLNHIASS